MRAEKNTFGRIKQKLPMFLRNRLGAIWSYFGRLFRWAAMLRDLRGSTPRDSCVLFTSACAAPITSARGLRVWKDPVILWDCAVRVVGVGSFNLRAKTDDLWHVYPGREPEVFVQISDFLRSGDVFIDAGANIGFYSVLASRQVGPSGRVLAIEMMPDTAERLRGHLVANRCDNAEVVDAALSDVEDEVVDAFLPRGQCGQASLARNHGQSQRVRVQTTTLDRVAGGFDRVRLLKMDLEGVELQALRGASGLLDRVDAVCFEDREGDSPVRAYLEARGFVLSPLGKADVLAVRHFSGNGRQ